MVVGDLIGSGASQEQAIVGETPNLAARLQSMQEPNSVVIAESTRKTRGQSVRVEELGVSRTKGIAGAREERGLRLRPASVESRFEAFHAAGLTDLGARGRWQRFSNSPNLAATIKLPVGGSSVRRAKNSIRNIKISASNGRISCRAKLKKARHNKHSPRGLRIKCFSDKQIRRFLAKRGQITLLGRVQIALNLNTDAVPSLITERRDFWLNSERADDGGGFANRVSKNNKKAVIPNSLKPKHSIA